jgi:hypothetical protein
MRARDPISGTAISRQGGLLEPSAFSCVEAVQRRLPKLPKLWS